jgi:D-alanyl-D-alanine carboxypeptidase
MNLARMVATAMMFGGVPLALTSAATAQTVALAPQPVSAPAPFSREVHQLVTLAGFSGEVGITSRDAALVYASSDQSDVIRLPWRWASVTKQVVAVLVMQEVARGSIDLDAPVSRYLPAFRSANASKVTVRQLLRHQSGLPNPDDRDGAFHKPGFDGSRDALTGFCAGPVTGPSGGSWTYNNCDYIVAGALLEAVSGKPWADLVRDRIAAPLGLTTLGAFDSAAIAERPGIVGGKPEPAFDLASFGASGALYGSVADLLAFDFALLNGDLLGADQLAQLWDGQPELGYIALGQWVFEAPVKGCSEPLRIVERRGAIGGVQVRNFILPDQDIAVAAFTNSGDFQFGEIWQGGGFSHDLLAIAACGAQ